jgi:hypothetical protein
MAFMQVNYAWWITVIICKHIKGSRIFLPWKVGWTEKNAGVCSCFLASLWSQTTDGEQVADGKHRQWADKYVYFWWCRGWEIGVAYLSLIAKRVQQLDYMDFADLNHYGLTM